jgi:hypothetical protein
MDDWLILAAILAVLLFGLRLVARWLEQVQETEQVRIEVGPQRFVVTAAGGPFVFDRLGNHFLARNKLVCALDQITAVGYRFASGSDSANTAHLVIHFRSGAPNAGVTAQRFGFTHGSDDPFADTSTDRIRALGEDIAQWLGVPFRRG